VDAVARAPSIVWRGWPRRSRREGGLCSGSGPKRPGPTRLIKHQREHMHACMQVVCLALVDRQSRGVVDTSLSNCPLPGRARTCVICFVFVHAYTIWRKRYTSCARVCNAACMHSGWHRLAVAVDLCMHSGWRVHVLYFFSSRSIERALSFPPARRRDNIHDVRTRARSPASYWAMGTSRARGIHACLERIKTASLSLHVRAPLTHACLAINTV
jgi:hypothetical protein